MEDDSLFDGGSRLSRVIGYEYRLDEPYSNAVITVGENATYSRSASMKSEINARFEEMKYGSDESGNVSVRGGGNNVYIITSHDSTPASNYNVFSALRALGTFLRKDADDSTPHSLGVGGGLAVGGDISAGGSVSASGVSAEASVTVGDGFEEGVITGHGGRIWRDVQTGQTRAELDSLTLRRFLEVPELRYNRVEVNVGNQWRAPGGGVIESVTERSSMTGECFLKLEDGEFGHVAPGDICMAIFHNEDGNAYEDADDGRGNFAFAGFSTCYFLINAVDGDHNGKFTYTLRDGYENMHPRPMMTFVAYGNTDRPDRQSSRYSTLRYERYLRDVSAWEFTSINIAAQFGDLSNLSLWNIDTSGYSVYIDNVYFNGRLHQLEQTVEAVSARHGYFVEMTRHVDEVLMDGLGRVELGDNVSGWRVSSSVSVRKGDSGLLLYTSGVPGDGEFSVSVNATGCDASVHGASVVVTGIHGAVAGSSPTAAELAAADAVRRCYVEVLVNCEGRTTIQRSMSVSVRRDGKDGRDGRRGAVLRGPQMWTDVADGFGFQCGGGDDDFMDVVIYGGHYYACKTSHAKSQTNSPAAAIGVLWDEFSKIDFVASKIVLSDYAYVQKMVAGGITMYDESAEADPVTGLKPVLFDAHGGNVTANTGTFRNVDVSGKITADTMHLSVASPNTRYLMDGETPVSGLTPVLSGTQKCGWLIIHREHDLDCYDLKLSGYNPVAGDGVRISVLELDDITRPDFNVEDTETSRGQGYVKFYLHGAASDMDGFGRARNVIINGSVYTLPTSATAPALSVVFNRGVSQIYGVREVYAGEEDTEIITWVFEGVRYHKKNW